MVKSELDFHGEDVKNHIINMDETLTMICQSQVTNQAFEP